jgi:tellurite resistance protein
MTTLDDAYRALEVEAVSPKVEALIEAMFLAAVADGHISPEESAKFAATVTTISKGKIPRASIDHRVGELTVLLASEGRKARLESLKKRLDPGTPRETALLLAAKITASDGEVVWKENDLLADLAEALEIPQTRAVDLVTKVLPKA